VPVLVKNLDLGYISPENEDKLRLDRATFPNLTRLQFTLTSFNRNPQKWKEFFISALKNCAGIHTIKEVRINVSSRAENKDVIDGLAESSVFEAKSIQKFALVFETNVLVDTNDYPSDKEHLYAVSLGETLSRTKSSF